MALSDPSEVPHEPAPLRARSSRLEQRRLVLCPAEELAVLDAWWFAALIKVLTGRVRLSIAGGQGCTFETGATFTLAGLRTARLANLGLETVELVGVSRARSTFEGIEQVEGDAP